MLRRQARLRREYLYRKAIEDRNRTIHEKKQKLLKSIEENVPIAPEIRKDAIRLQRYSEWDDAGADPLINSMDDEYKNAGVEDPQIMVTTSRDPSTKLKQFAKEIRLIFPNSKKINRGNYELKQLIDACHSNNVTDLIILHEHRGVPDAMTISHLPYGPTAYFSLFNVVMRHDIPDVGTMSEAYPHLIFHNFGTRLGRRVVNILKYLNPVPKEDSKRVMTFANSDDFISYRHHVYSKNTETKKIELTEVGPRFEMKLYKIILGTIDNADTADVEWVYKPYMRTTAKRTFLAEQS
ncbi:U3 small nucleolar ribonucleoprotein protein IMP4-like [Argonauta hians]